MMTGIGWIDPSEDQGSRLQLQNIRNIKSKTHRDPFFITTDTYEYDSGSGGAVPVRDVLQDTHSIAYLSTARIKDLHDHSYRLFCIDQTRCWRKGGRY